MELYCSYTDIFAIAKTTYKQVFENGYVPKKNYHEPFLVNKTDKNGA